MSEGKKDEALMQPTLCTGLEGVEQVVDFLKNSTPEVKRLIKEECDVIYECRFCRNFFRSIINFVTHKRAYCRSLHKKLDVSLPETSSQECVEGEGEDDRSSNSDQSANGVSEEQQQESKAVARRQLLDDFSFGKRGRRKIANKKTSANLRHLNQVTKVTKRMGTTSLKGADGSRLQLHTLPSIAKIVPETTFVDGVQIVTKKPEGLVSKEGVGKTEEKVLMVMPQDLSSRYVNMQLRNRSKNSNYTQAAKEFHVNDVEIIDRFTTHKIDINVDNITCVPCERSFTSFELLAYHATVKHNPYPFDNNPLCFICGRTYQSKESLRVHFHNKHKSVQDSVMAIRRSFGSKRGIAGLKRGRKKKIVEVPVAEEEGDLEDSEMEESEMSNSDEEEEEETNEAQEPEASARKSSPPDMVLLGSHPCTKCNKASFTDPKNLERHLQWCKGNEDSASLGRQRKGQPQRVEQSPEEEDESGRSRSETPQHTPNSEDGSAKRISVRLAEKTDRRTEDGEPLSVMDMAVRKKDRDSYSPERSAGNRMEGSGEEPKEEEEEQEETEDEKKQRELREKRKNLIDEVLKNSQEILASSPSAVSQEQISEMTNEESSETKDVRELLRETITEKKEEAPKQGTKVNISVPVQNPRPKDDKFSPCTSIPPRAPKPLVFDIPRNKPETGNSESSPVKSFVKKAETEPRPRRGRPPASEMGSRKRRSLKTPARFADFELGTGDTKKPKVEEEKNKDGGGKKEKETPDKKKPKIAFAEKKTEKQRGRPKAAKQDETEQKKEEEEKKPVTKKQPEADVVVVEKTLSIKKNLDKSKVPQLVPLNPLNYEGLRATPVFLTAVQQEILKRVMDDPSGVCYICQIKFNQIATARRHVMNHLDFVRFICKQCSAAAFFVSDMRRHIMEGHCRGVSAEEYQRNFPEGMNPGYNRKADQLIKVCYPEKPGRVQHWKGKVVALECLWGRDFFDMRPQELPDKVVDALRSRNQKAPEKYLPKKREVMETDFEYLGGYPHPFKKRPVKL